MKKSLALVLVLAMAFALAIPAFATEELPTATVTPEVVVDGTDVTVNFYLPAGVQPAATTFTIAFDANALEFLEAGAKKGDLLFPASPADNEIEPGLQKVAIATSGMGSTEAGRMAFVSFELIKEDVKTLDFTVEFEYIYWYDAGTELPIEWADGTKGNKGTFSWADPNASDDPVTTEPTTTEPTTTEPTTTEPTTTEPAGDVNPPSTGAMSMVAIAAVSAIAGMGALGLRKKEN